MWKSVQIKIALFITVICLMTGAIVGSAGVAWRDFRHLRNQLTTIELESFHIADDLQHTILLLNTYLLKYEINHEPKTWEEYERESKRLDTWIDEQVGKVATIKEKEVLEQVDNAYDHYLDAALALKNPPAGEALKELANFETESQALLNTGYRLAEAHRESRDQFLEQTQNTLALLSFILLSALFLLIFCVTALAFIVFKQLIAPLQTKLVQSHATIERQEKLASLGLLASGVAHEIRNPLTAIKAKLFAWQRRMPAESPEHLDARFINEEISRLERILRDFLLFARPSDPVMIPVPPTSLMGELKNLFNTQYEKRNIVIRTENPDGGSPLILADPQQLKQVLINLIQNGAESIESSSGEILLRTRIEPKPTVESPHGNVVLEVQDTGKGIPAEVEKRLFDPFFTTKEAGTGLGLSIAMRIVQKHGGQLRYRTQVNVGTTFGIVLPRILHAHEAKAEFDPGY
jgi:signal transduction histidine kinase